MLPQRDSLTALPRAEGFTIFELALALFLIGLLLGGIAVPLQTQIDSRKVEETEQLLAEAREALIGYAAAHGYLPCPADAASGGLEPEESDHVTGKCPSYYGFLPAATLGFRRSDGYGYAADAWGGAANRIRYAVSNQTIGPAGNTNALTRTGGMRTAAIANLSDSALSLFHVCDRAYGVSPGASCGSAGTLVSSAPVVIWSSGPNAATGGAGSDEAQNPNPNGGSADRVFVSRTRSTIPGNEFDDLVAWMPMPVLVARMVAAGQLP
jgi:type II secretory pathway pseudopilin PulG